VGSLTLKFSDEQSCKKDSFRMRRHPGLISLFGLNSIITLERLTGAAMLEAEITQTWMFVRTASKWPVILAI
jgi:hypothetical protein